MDAARTGMKLCTAISAAGRHAGDRIMVRGEVTWSLARTTRPLPVRGEISKRSDIHGYFLGVLTAPSPRPSPSEGEGVEARFWAAPSPRPSPSEGEGVEALRVSLCHCKFWAA